MEKPNIKPVNANFSSGPCSKRPGWTIDALKNSPIGRSHRHKVCKEKLNEVINNLGNMDPRKNKHAEDNRRDLLIALGQVRTDLGFLQPDIRYKWERKEIMNNIDDLMELIAKKRFF